MLVISPHLDDAVLSCGESMAAHPGTTVLTVFAGTPQHASQSTDWDRHCGFASADEAVDARRHEDRVALARLGARPAWLSFADSQYGEPADDATIAEAIGEVLHAHPDVPVLLPIGLFHSDHLQTHRAALRALSGTRRDGLFVYEDVPYRRQPGRLQARLAELHAAGTTLTPARFAVPPGGALKQMAVRAYASQLRALDPGGVSDTTMPERCWRIEPPAVSSPSPELLDASR